MISKAATEYRTRAARGTAIARHCRLAQPGKENGAGAERVSSRAIENNAGLRQSKQLCTDFFLPPRERDHPSGCTG
jgi:hypothetical protein